MLDARRNVRHSHPDSCCDVLDGLRWESKIVVGNYDPLLYPNAGEWPCFRKYLCAEAVHVCKNMPELEAASKRMMHGSYRGNIITFNVGKSNGK